LTTRLRTISPIKSAAATMTMVIICSSFRFAVCGLLVRLDSGRVNNFACETCS
jgi:hypothetical protein